jgi:heme-degrading monooxygenase HmoA
VAAALTYAASVFVVIFEVQPRPELWDAYLDTARMLRPELEQIDGFLDNDRFKSDRNARCVLSLSTWRDEKALIRWRTQAMHYRVGQVRGREAIFANYRLRVGEVVTDSRLPAGAELSQQRFDTTEINRATAVTLTESSSAPEVPPGALEDEAYTSLVDPQKRVQVLAWATVEQALAHTLPSGLLGPESRRRTVRIIRDYGLLDRREAPQYFPAVGVTQAE